VCVCVEASVKARACLHPFDKFVVNEVAALRDL
jgi:hypothetical protein